MKKVLIKIDLDDPKIQTKELREMGFSVQKYKNAMKQFKDGCITNKPSILTTFDDEGCLWNDSKFGNNEFEYVSNYDRFRTHAELILVIPQDLPRLKEILGVDVPKELEYLKIIKTDDNREWVDGIHKCQNVLKNLLSLSKFVTNLQKSTVEDMHNLLGINYHSAIPITIFNYNDFLNKQYEKSMFVNPYKRPMNLMSKTYSFDREMFDKGEKEVIFNGILRSDGYYLNDNRRYHFQDMLIGIETLGELAEATGGELTLKNVTI